MTALPGADAGAQAAAGLPAVWRELSRIAQSGAQAERRLCPQAAVAQLAERALHGEPLARLREAATALLARALDVELSSVMWLAEDGTRLDLVAGVGWEPGTVGAGLPFSIHDTLAGAALAHGAPVIVDDLAREGRYALHRVKVAHGVRSGIHVVIQGRDRRHGVLQAHSRRPRRFGAEEAHFVSALAHLLAVALERERMEARLVRSDRMASVGALAAGVAHELNNPLAYASSNLDYADQRLGELARALGDGTGGLRAQVAEVREALADARQGADRMRVIVRDLKTFSRPDEDTRCPVDLAQVVESSIQMAWTEIRHRARLVRRFQAAPRVLANEARLGQVFVNLLVNAAHAIREGDASRHLIEVEVGTSQRGEACVAVRDSGCGIPAQDLARIFEPFFTTKPVGVGTGLGLSVCQGIVAGLQGRIEVESTPGRGATFRVLLPAAGAEDGVAESGPAPLASPPRRGRLLVVDDERLLLACVERALRGEHEVVTRPCARAALELLAGGEDFDLILCDVMMPDVSGMDFHEALGRCRPGLRERVVYMTGGAFSPHARAFLDSVTNERLEKPFAPHALRALVARRLAPPPPPGR